MPFIDVRQIAVGSIATLLGALSPALAGDLGAPAPEPVVFAPAPVAQSYDWSGPYAGAQLGWGWADAAPGIDGGDEWLGGVHVGYRWDFGTWVAGGELEYNWTDIDLRGTTEDANVSGIFSVKALAGVEAGPALIYGTLGWAQAQVDGNFDAILAGVGVAYPFRDRWVASGEWIYYAADDYSLDEADDAWANTLTVRLSYRF
jgi:outer membrane immunogenic protein